MVTVICNADGCANNGVTYNVLGAPAYVECGGCHEPLEPTDHRDDPEPPQMVFPEAPQ
jgi:hypothetical protein